MEHINYDGVKEVEADADAWSEGPITCETMHEGLDFYMEEIGDSRLGLFTHADRLQQQIAICLGGQIAPLLKQAGIPSSIVVELICTGLTFYQAVKDQFPVEETPAMPVSSLHRFQWPDGRVLTDEETVAYIKQQNFDDVADEDMGEVVRSMDLSREAALDIIKQLDQLIGDLEKGTTRKGRGIIQ